MSSKLFKAQLKHKENLPMESVHKGAKETHSNKPVKASNLKNPGKAKFAESLNNYNVVREKIEHEMTGARSSIAELPAKNKVSIGLS